MTKPCQRNDETHLFRFLVHHVLILGFLQTPRVKRVLSVYNLICFPSGNFNLTSICYNHVVTTVNCFP